MRAYCFADGVIRFGPRLPKGALPIAEAPAKKLRPIIDANARWAYPSKPGAGDGVPLVPGIPEAKDENAKLDALLSFCERVEFRLARVNRKS